MVKAKRSCFHDKFHISKVNAEMLGKFIRADNGLNIRSKKQAQEDRLRDLKAQFAYIKKQIDDIEKN